MSRPLYQFPDTVGPTLGHHGHRGLWYDKFCSHWSPTWRMKAEDRKNPKLTWIKTVVGTVGSREALEEYARRLFELAAAHGGAMLVAKAQSRFVTGLGRSHPVENGFAWHPTLGTPYLAGSSVKGLVRAWAVETRKDEDEVKHLLGGPGHAGAVAFLDAVPLRQVVLEADVLTPHYANWTVDKPPGDWLPAQPVPFLVAAPGLSMLFGLVPLGSRRHDGEIETVREWLTFALDGSGAGAKTAVGYGHFREDTRDSTLARWQEDRRRREAMATPTGRWLLAIKGRSEQEILGLVHEHLMKMPLQDTEERREFVEVILGTGRVTSWKRGERVDDRTAMSRKKLKEYARTVLNCAAELGIEPPR